MAEKPATWLAPLLLFIAVFYLYPLIDVIRLSFTNAGSVSQPYVYTLSSFSAVLTSPDFAAMLTVTVIFVIASVAGQLIAGLLIATLLIEGEKRRLPGASFVRSVVLIGWVLPGVVIGIVWKLLLDETGSGILASVATAFGWTNVTFLSAAGPALFWVIVANIWRGTAFSMLMQYSGMKTISPELYEAARVDGAGFWQQFRYITIPSLKRVTMINLILISIATLNTFDMIVPLTGGGPGRATEVIALYIYNVVFVEFSLGRGAAVAVILMLFGLALTLLYFRFFLAREDEEGAS
ncbi:carbohydrate ABC transporter permease [Kaistia sp. 32K]|uniref:carbohydrate ABC transporter permease n=1 Tax=Kaistia sp. 32K TaxID=2795690 RepID=UPI00191593B3|nr:sugar ABC transporter permease [Kaistia sp. 32K]